MDRSHAEHLVRTYVDGWKEYNSAKVLSSLDPACILIESDGEIFRGADTIASELDKRIAGTYGPWHISVWDITTLAVEDELCFLEWQQPRQTSHVCPRCGSPANTYSSPEHRDTINDWGAWLCCSNPHCLWNGSRDYAASLNIARLGAALIRLAQRTSRVKHPAITDLLVQPVSYMGTQAALRLPPLSLRGHLIASGRIYCNGWRLSVKLRSSYSTPIMLRLCG
ncbi:MAG: hypothetical protein ACLQUY_27785 [Ktedonobacterales bacterium]